MDRETRHIKESFIRTSISNQSKPEISDGIKTLRFYALRTDQSFVKRFKLCFRDGRCVSVPYAFLPVIEFDINGQIKITSGEIEIRILGRGLQELENWLTEEKVIWISESESGQDEEDEEVFVSSIETEGL